MDELELRVAWDHHVAVGASRAAADGWLDSLLARHREPHRRYHTVRHLRWVVRHVLDLAASSAAAGRVDDLSAVVAAAFFHDAVYDPRSTGNEAASAALAERALGELGWSDARAGRVGACVRATADHAHATDDDDDEAALDTAILLAADLAVLASDPAGYAEYVNGVRSEYTHVSDDDWRRGRTAVLQAFLERRAIYAPELDLDAWERRARANLAAELAELSAG